MVPQALRMAESAFKRYKTRDPFEIMDARRVLLKEFAEPRTLLGFFTVMNRRQVIGLNRAADDVQRLTGAIHELGHSLNDYRTAASGGRFEDCKFFSLSNAPSEFNANLTGADLFIPDEYILDRVSYGDYVRLVQYIGGEIGRFRTGRERMRFEEEQMREFYDCHSALPSLSQLAAELGVDEGVVKFKLKALSCREYELPNLPEAQGDFLRNWQKTAGR